MNISVKTLLIALCVYVYVISLSVASVSINAKSKHEKEKTGSIHTTWFVIWDAKLQCGRTYKLPTQNKSIEALGNPSACLSWY